MSFLQRWGLIVVAARVLEFLERFSGSDSAIRPTIFLGEKYLSQAEWSRQRALLASTLVSPRDQTTGQLLRSDLDLLPRVCVLVSLYKSDAYLAGFLSNLLHQSYFSKLEVQIISVLPTSYVSATLKEFSTNHKNVHVTEFFELIGIYEAWNRGIKSSTCDYLTNMNVDDQRAPNSIEIQVRELLRSDADVVYQDVFIALEENVTWFELTEMRMRTNFPAVSTKLLASGMNVVHNAPMWKKSLHSRIGYFDESFRSAGDHDFWIRASVANAKFHKCEDVHVGYFINPVGMSTKRSSPGVREGARILRKYRNLA